MKTELNFFVNESELNYLIQLAIHCEEGIDSFFDDIRRFSVS